MEVISGRPVSALNPNAPLFVPMAYREVEDFSDQWWDLVKSNPWFRDYWLRECFLQESDDLDILASVDEDERSALPELEEIFEAYQQRGEENEKGKGRELVSWGAEKWNGMRSQRRIPAPAEKAPKIVKVKLSPRTIQQPR